MEASPQLLVIHTSHSQSRFAFAQPISTRLTNSRALLLLTPSSTQQMVSAPEMPVAAPAAAAPLPAMAEGMGAGGGGGGAGPSSGTGGGGGGSGIDEDLQARLDNLRKS